MDLGRCSDPTISALLVRKGGEKDAYACALPEVRCAGFLMIMIYSIIKQQIVTENQIRRSVSHCIHPLPHRYLISSYKTHSSSSPP